MPGGKKADGVHEELEEVRIVGHARRARHAHQRLGGRHQRAGGAQAGVVVEVVANTNDTCVERGVAVEVAVVLEGGQHALELGLVKAALPGEHTDTGGAVV